MEEITALLNERLAAARSEGYDEGYTAGMQNVIDTVCTMLADDPKEDTVVRTEVRPDTVRGRVLEAYRAEIYATAPADLIRSQRKLLRGLNLQQVRDASGHLTKMDAGLRRVSRGVYEAL